MAQRHDTRSNCTMEGLEGRTLLSGSVSAYMVEGNLTVEGDDVSNSIIIDQVGLAAGQVRISGSNATSINGQADPVVFEGFTGDLFAQLRHGPDSLELRDIVLPGRLDIRSGLGMDRVVLFNVSVAGDTAIRTGVRADAIEIDDSILTGATLINTRWGVDSLRIEQSGAEDGVRSFFHGPAEFRLSRGDDDMRIGLDANAGNWAVFYGNVNVEGGLDYDEASSAAGNWFDFVPVVTNCEFSSFPTVLA